MQHFSIFSHLVIWHFWCMSTLDGNRPSGGQSPYSDCQKSPKQYTCCSDVWFSPLRTCFLGMPMEHSALCSVQSSLTAKLLFTQCAALEPFQSEVRTLASPPKVSVKPSETHKTFPADSVFLAEKNVFGRFEFPTLFAVGSLNSAQEYGR